MNIRFEFTVAARIQLESMSWIEKNNKDGLNAKSIEFEWLIFNAKHEYVFDLGQAMRLSWSEAESFGVWDQVSYLWWSVQTSALPLFTMFELREYSSQQ